MLIFKIQQSSSRGRVKDVTDKKVKVNFKYTKRRLFSIIKMKHYQCKEVTLILNTLMQQNHAFFRIYLLGNGEYSVSQKVLDFCVHSSFKGNQKHIQKNMYFSYKLPKYCSSKIAHMNLSKICMHIFHYEIVQRTMVLNLLKKVVSESIMITKTTHKDSV